MIESALQSRLQQQTAAQLYRTRHVSTQDAHCNFSSNDYLSLSKHPELIHATQKALTQYGMGSGASYLVTGYGDAHKECEAAFAEFLQRDRTLLFANGYMANLGVLDALTQHGDVILQDRKNHASLIDGGRLSRASVLRYHHQDMQHLEERLELCSKKNTLIATDAVFSMSGQTAPLPTLTTLANKHNSLLLVDDAHGIGVLGPTGRGSLEAQNVLSENAAPILVCPLGKAFGVYGAIVAGNAMTIESLIQFARSYIYTTALPPALAVAAMKSLSLLKKESWRRDTLHANIQFFKQKAEERALPLLPSNTAIQCISASSAQKALHISETLYQLGFLVTAMRPPTVSEPLLRITLNTTHTKKQITTLVDALHREYSL